MSAARNTTFDSTEPVNQEEDTVNERLETLITDQNILAAATIEQANELVMLDKDPVTNKWFLSLGQSYNNQWQDATENDDISTRNGVFIISVLGNTTAGKSFITKHLSANFETGPQIVDESEIESSTTANINCYQSRLGNELPETILILDYEGEKGSSYPLMLYARRLIAESVGLSGAYAKERRKAVTEYFPKLAYVLSNIVILIGKEELISADYLNRCYEFAQSANTNITDIPYLPVLIIIENKCSLAKKFGIDDVTDEFFRIHQRESDNLQRYFSKIYCIRLPHTEQSQKVRGCVLNGEIIFQEQLSALKNLIKEIIVQDRERMITHAQWLFLLQHILRRVSNGDTASIHSLLLEITSSKDDDKILRYARKFFRFIYNDKVIHTPQFYRDCRRLAMQMFCRNLAMKLFDNDEILSERFIRDMCKTQLSLMWNILDKFKPCEAPYTGEGNSVSGHPVFCYQSKNSHPCHRTCEGIKNLTWLSSFIGFSSTVTWRGNFVSSDTGEFSENELENFTNLTMKFVNSFKINSQEQIKIFGVLLREARIDQVPPMIETRRCNCCLEKGRLPELSPMALMYMEILGFVPPTDVLTICKTCHEELAKFSLCDNSNVCSNISNEALTTETSADPTAMKEDDCVICMAAKKSHVLVPCGHMGFCSDCATKVAQVNRFCPICRKSIYMSVKIRDV